MPTQLTPETVERIENEASLYKWINHDKFTAVERAALILGYISGATTEALKSADEIELYKNAAETNHKQVIELATLATDEKAKSVEKDKEIERLKGLIQKIWNVSAAYLRAKNREQGWQQFKTENNL